MFRFSPEKSQPATEVRARASKQQQSESIPENIPETRIPEEKAKTAKPKPSRKWRWILLFVVLILIALVVYNFEQLPIPSKGPQSALPGPPAPPKSGGNSA